MWRTFLCVIVCVSVLGPALAQAAPKEGALHVEVPLIVEEPAGVARTNAPVTGGIPLPPGAVKSVDDLALLGPDKKVPNGSRMH